MNLTLWPIILMKTHGQRTAHAARLSLSQHDIDAEGVDWVNWLVPTTSVYVPHHLAENAEHILRQQGFEIVGNPLT